MERRTFLVLGGALALGGCTRAARPDPLPPSPGPGDPDATLRRASAASELALIAAYRDTIGEFPELAAQLRPLAAHHRAHLAAIDPTAAAGAATAAGDPAEGRPGAEPRARTAAQALEVLAAEESAARQQRATACDGVQEAALARVLCLVAASEAQHAVVLTEWSEQGSAG